MLTSSVAFDILEAVSTAIQAITGGPWGEHNVRARRRLAWVRESDPLPFVCLAVEDRRVYEHQFGNMVMWDYPVLMGLFDESKLVLEGLALKQWLKTQHDLSLALFKTTLTLAPEVFDVADYDPGIPFDKGAFDQSLDVTVSRVTYRSREARSS